MVLTEKAYRMLVAAARMNVVMTAKQVLLMMMYAHSTVVVASTWRELQTDTA